MGLTSLSKKTRKSNQMHWDIIEQRQHLLLNHFKIPSVGPAGNRTRVSHTIGWHLIYYVEPLGRQPNVAVRFKWQGKCEKIWWVNFISVLLNFEQLLYSHIIHYTTCFNQDMLVVRNYYRYWRGEGSDPSQKSIDQTIYRASNLWMGPYSFAQIAYQ